MEILWNTHVYNRKVLLKSLKKEKFTNKNGSHSALNMFTEYSMTDPGDLAEYFGFTEQEISALCEKYEMSFEEAKTWYDGYQLITHRQTGDEIYSMYSPKSVVEAMLRQRFLSFLFAPASGRFSDCSAVHSACCPALVLPHCLNFHLLRFLLTRK